ncbi:MAG: hypothetical protein NTY09_04025 [bacterium]|nr:hypothetical protein [bacterium]
MPGVDRNLRDSIAIATGLALLSYLIFLSGSIFGVKHVVLYLLVIIPFLATLPWTIYRIRIFRNRIFEALADFKSPDDKALLVLIGILFILDLINGGNAAVGWDAAVDHYAIPEGFLRTGSFIPDFGNPFSFYPSLGEMLFILGLGIGREFLAGAMSWLYLFPMALGFLSIGKSLGNSRIGLWAIFLFLGAPLTFELPFSGVVDLQFLTYCLLALALLLDSSAISDYRKFILIGILVGCACATKHLGLLFLPAFIIILIWKIFADIKPGINWLVASILVIFFSIIVPLPWYVRSFNWAGDALYPYLSNFGNASKEITGSLSVESFAQTKYPRTFINFFGYLWHLTMDYWDLRPWYLAIHPVWLAFLPPAIVFALVPSNRKDRQVITNFRLVLVLAVITMAINYFLAPSFPRYMFPTWFAMAIISAYILTEIRRIWPPIGKIITLVVLMLPFIIVFAMAGKRAIEVVPQYFSDSSRAAAISNSFKGYETIEWVNENLDPDFDVVLTTDPKVYYIKPYAIVSKSGIESSLLVNWASDPSEIIQNWRELGVTHFILDTTLDSVNGGFALLVVSSILGDRDAAWMDPPRTIEASNEFGLNGFLTEAKLIEFSKYAGLPIVEDGTPGGNHLFTRERMQILQSRGLDYAMAEKVIKFINAGILVKEFSSGPEWGVVAYSVHLPESDEIELPELPDLTLWGTNYENGPVEMLKEDERL